MLKVLHLASFNGNIGDTANHTGFWELFRKYVTADVSVDYLEIREFYKSWGKRRFDDSFADLVNGYDLLVVGGGNFFDVRWDYSRTGTTTDIPPELLERIRVPVVFNGMGIDFDEGRPNEAAREKFIRYLDYLDRHSGRYIVTIRNDDSDYLLNRYFHGSEFQHILRIPDGGFFTSAKEYFHPEIPENKRVFAVNVAKDRMGDRWADLDKYDSYCAELAGVINRTLETEEDTHFVFVPHIPGDIEATRDIMKYIKDPLLRQRVTMAPHLTGMNTHSDYQTDLYRKSFVAVSMRYHSNICAIAMGTPTIGIVTLKKHVLTYRNIGMADRLLDVIEPGFSGQLLDRIREVTDNREKYVRENRALVEKLEQQSVPYYRKIGEILEGRIG